MTIEELESAVSRLPPDQLSQFSQWFQEFLGEQWDRRIEADAAAGKLDQFAAEAVADYRAGKAREI